MQGVIVHYNEDRGFGFIRVKDRQKDVFVHFRDVDNPEQLQIGRIVDFDLTYNEKGARAVKVKTRGMQKSPAVVTLTVSFFLCLGMVGIAWIYEFPPVLAYLIAINICTSLYYALDKLCARLHYFRIPEMTLHVLTLLGGTPAAWLSQRYLRHKSIKEAFRFGFYLIVTLQGGLIILWLYVRWIR